MYFASEQVLTDIIEVFGIQTTGRTVNSVVGNMDVCLQNFTFCRYFDVFVSGEYTYSKLVLLDLDSWVYPDTLIMTPL